MMELKPYQQEVINDLDGFLKALNAAENAPEAFYNFWSRHPKTPLLPLPGMAIEPYKNNVPQVPHVCIKVPTAGGKTFIACNAIKTIFNAFNYGQEKAVVWMVPSVTILEQTIKHLKNNEHPYRQKINAQFGNRVEVYDKQALLQGSSFNATSVKEQLSIFVLSFDSLRAKNKDERRVYQENSNLQSFGKLPGNHEAISLMRVIQSLNPVVIVDESHNAESELSIEMLKDLNPCFILDLTATPRKNSNIISFVDAMALKREHMVKLPIIVYDLRDRTEVISAAVALRRRLETDAKKEEKNGGKHIRPIVLFQAQPKNAADATTFHTLKERLIESGIAEEEIKIKTAEINELKGIDLAAEDCPVRYIITVNALKEGWDCPFAYILASLADKSSAVDVEQVLGRILRQPYVMEHDSDMLNSSYVLTASGKFLDTLENIVKALNKSGYSEKDFKAYVHKPEEAEQAYARQTGSVYPGIIPPEMLEDPAFESDKARLMDLAEFNGSTPFISEIANRVKEQHQAMHTSVAFKGSVMSLPTELKSLVAVYTIRKTVAQQALELRLPQFYIHKSSGDIFGGSEQLLSRENLLEGFRLSKCDSNINFDAEAKSPYIIDLDITRKDAAPGFIKSNTHRRALLLHYISDPAKKDYWHKNLTAAIINEIGNFNAIAEPEIRKYISKLLEDFTDEHYRNFFENLYVYSTIIKEKIKTLSEAYAEQQFKNYLDTDKIISKSGYAFPKEIIPGHTSKHITNSLYEREAAMNGFEENVINEIANLPNVVFWTKNMEKKQFVINGFLNHYPDFIIQTQRKTIVLETKGDDRDNSDSEAKLRLGKAWEQKAGNSFKYFMVFDKQDVPGAHKLADFLQLIKGM